jgi:hypothetical protein
MKLEEKASEPLRLPWPKVGVGSFLSTVGGSTQTFISVDVISFESCLGVDPVILGVFGFWLTSSLARILTWAALARSHQANPWLSVLSKLG